MINYCSDCGTRIDKDELYCPECGCRLKEEGQKGREVSEGDEIMPSESACVSGYILTNLKALSKKLNTPINVLRHHLEQYISFRCQCGINYTLLDVAEYSPKQSVNRDHFPFVIHLTPDDGWQAHQRLLMDRYFYDIEREKVEYLFIIGSDDIIPMPAVGKHSDEYSSPILSDLPYSHLYGDQTESMIDSHTIYQQPQMLFVGRLPLADDATFDMLLTYLHNVCEVSLNGLNLGRIYGQCDPHWKKVTSFISGGLYDAGWFLDYSSFPEKYVYRSLLLTPFITKDNIEEVFCPDASIYLFNMHGDDHPANNDYYGVEVLPNGKDGTSYSGITPKQFRSMQSLNIVVAEPCFGAKPNKRKHCESILLSSLITKTVLFFGSTHKAWGGIDPSSQITSLSDDFPSICCADIMAIEVINVMLQGFPAGIALWQGRAANFQQDGITPSIIDTCLEFNLFGDPSLTINGIQSDKKGAYISWQHTAKSLCRGITERIIYPVERKNRMKVTTVFSRERTSVLDWVRNAVNENWGDIQKKVNKYLYDNYNIAPRQLNRILRISYTYGEDIYAYYYEDVDMNYVVTVDSKSRIKSIISSR